MNIMMVQTCSSHTCAGHWIHWFMSVKTRLLLHALVLHDHAWTTTIISGRCSEALLTVMCGSIPLLATHPQNLQYIGRVAVEDFGTPGDDESTMGVTLKFPVAGPYWVFVLFQPSDYRMQWFEYTTTV